MFSKFFVKSEKELIPTKSAETKQKEDIKIPHGHKDVD